MVKKVAQRAIAAGLAGMMSFGAAVPAAMAIDGTTWTTKPWWNLSPVTEDDDLTFWTRIKGDTRYDTMKKILEACYISATDGHGDRWVNAAEAVIASGDNFPDALAANGLAGTLNNGAGAPVILTKKGALSSQAKTILEKMQVQHVYIMGGTAAVSQEVEDAISNLKIAVTRVAGADRQETSMKAFNLISGNWYKNYGTHSVIIATGASYADALSIAPFAYQTGTPIVLTKADGTLTDAQINAIKDNEEIWNIIVVGGEKAVSASVFGTVGTFNTTNTKYQFNYTGVRIDGADRYETSANIADWEVNYAKRAYNRVYGGKDLGSVNYGGGYGGTLDVTRIGDCYFDWDFVFVATGENFPDALAGAQLAGGSYYSVGGGYIAHKNKQGNYEGYVSGSPILLVKDGDRTAESVLAKNLAAKFNVYTGTWTANATYSTARDLYCTWFDYNNILTGLGTMTAREFIDTYLATGFFTQDAIVPLDFLAGNYSTWNGQISNNNGTLAKIMDTATNVCLGISIGNLVFDQSNKFIGTINTAGDTLTYASSGIAVPVYMAANDGSINAIADLFIYDSTVGAQSDFHGIIFGGTAAVSKDKAKDLDKAVKDVIPTYDYTNGLARRYDVDNPNQIINQLLQGNTFYAYAQYAPLGYDGQFLDHYYCPAADDAIITDFGANYTTYTMPFYHYAYTASPYTGTAWAYVDTVDLTWVVNRNTGAILAMPWFM
jgi:putative cell wall-binding protein